MNYAEKLISLVAERRGEISVKKCREGYEIAALGVFVIDKTVPGACEMLVSLYRDGLMAEIGRIDEGDK